MCLASYSLYLLLERNELLEVPSMIKMDEVILRAPEISDVELLYQWENDKSLWHLSNTITPFSRFTLEQYVLSADTDIFSAKQLRLMIDFDEKTVGCIDLFNFDANNKRAGIGIIIDEKYRQKSIATKALAALIHYCFTDLDLHQIYCNICEDNKESLSLFEKKDFTIVGKKKEWIRKGDKWMDEYLLQLLKKDL